MKLKVLHAINSLSTGGAELHLLTLCRYLKRLGVEMAVAYLKEGRGSRPLRPDFEAAGIPVFYLGGEGKKYCNHIVPVTSMGGANGSKRPPPL
jgi:hypothetical protein